MPYQMRPAGSLNPWATSLPIQSLADLLDDLTMNGDYDRSVTVGDTEWRKAPRDEELVDDIRNVIADSVTLVTGPAAAFPRVESPQVTAEAIYDLLESRNLV